MARRIIEIFVAGCPLCDQAVAQVRNITCESCDVRILDMRTDKTVMQMAAQYGVSRVPAIVIDGKLASCCSQSAVDMDALKALGVGKPL